MTTCALPSCNNKAYGGKWCNGHRLNARKYGVPNPPQHALIVGKRTLLAKTCLGCGELKSSFRRVNGYWKGLCRECTNADNAERAERLGYYKRHRDYNVPRHNQSTKESMRRYQEETLPGATKHYEPYTGADWEIILRDDLTTKEKALMLHRTHKAIDNALQRHRQGDQHA